MNVCNSGFIDWDRRTLIVTSSVKLTLNSHPISNLAFLDLNSLTFKGEKIGEKCAYFLLDYGIPIGFSDLISEIYR